MNDILALFAALFLGTLLLAVTLVLVLEESGVSIEVRSEHKEPQRRNRNEKR